MESYYYDAYTGTKIKVSLNTKGNKPLANASVYLQTTYFGFLTIKKFQIWKSPRMNTRLNAQINVTPPSIPIRGKKNFFFVFFENGNNVESWTRLEEQIYKAYLEASRSNEVVGKTNNDDNTPITNPDDIPF